MLLSVIFLGEKMPQKVTKEGKKELFALFSRQKSTVKEALEAFDTATEAENKNFTSVFAQSFFWPLFF